MAQATRAVAYYRMSDDRQENSIERQGSQVESYALRQGYLIVREYVDEGIPGDEAEKRKDFMRMLRDAQQLRDFEVILCDDKDRFGRFDSIDQGYYVKPLRDIGVRLETVAQGRIDWGSFAGRVTDAVLQEAKKVERQAISRRVLTHMLDMARAQKWTGGPAPYGYRLVPDPVRIKRLVPDPRTAKVVQLIFDLYGNRGFSLDAIARELYLRGIPGPGRPGPNGEPPAWKKPTIRFILRNRKYVGDWRWNADHDGKYSDVVGGLVRTHDAKVRRRANRPEDWILVPDSHEPLVGRDLFERVQERLERNRKRTTPLPNGGDFLLAGLLVCGHCGWRMIGTRNAAGNRVYYCGRYHDEGKHACSANRMRELPLVNFLVRKLQQDVLNPDNLIRLRQEIRRQDEAAAAGASDRARELRKRIEELTVQVDQGAGRMAMIPLDLLADYAACIRGWKEERDRLAAELNRLERGSARQDAEREVEEAERQLWRLREAILSEDAVDVRAVLQEMVSKVELWFSHRKTARTTRSTFTRGLITLRTDEHLCNLESAARRPPTAPGSGR
jgi:DNA invertase Pin-like site-specific DNA recombinase